MRHDAIDIAGFVVNVAHGLQKNITNLQLQKILYYLEAKHLFDEGEPLFNDDIEAWKLGPVYPSVYHEYKVFGSHGIDFIPKIFKVENNEHGELSFRNYDYDDRILPENLRVTLEPRITNLLRFNPFELVKRTHGHEPWIEMEPKINANQRGLKYNKGELMEYFRENPMLLNEVLD